MILEYASSSNEAMRDVWIACSRDFLFWLNVFGWTYDPRLRRQKTVPFITYGFQDRCLLITFESIGEEDIVIEKTRDMGATWMIIALYVWFWLFRPDVAFLMVSRKAELVDTRDDPRCLFWKADFLIKWLPSWMTPAFSRTKFHLFNMDTGATIDGEATVGDLARGDRRTSILLDEFAHIAREDGPRVDNATADATNNRVMLSTPNGTANTYYEYAHNPETIKVSLHWSEHPKKRVGLYTSSTDGNLIILDKNFTYEKDYSFVLDGKLHSYWYDKECKRRVSKTNIAQELDIDYLESGYQFFDKQILDTQLSEYCRKPYKVGELIFDKDTGHPIEFKEAKNGRLKLWTLPDVYGNIPRDRRYVIGADVAVGTGASNSAAAVIDTITGEKVAEFASPYISAYDFGTYLVALGYYFAGKDGEDGAYLGWEANGEGRACGKRIRDLGYGHIYFKKMNDKAITAKRSKIPGWTSTKDTKRDLLTELERAWGTGEFMNRSRLSISEARQYIYDGERVIHAKATTRDDPTNTGDNHGDRVIADGVAWHLASETSRDIEEDWETPPDCYQARREEYEKSLTKADLW